MRFDADGSGGHQGRGHRLLGVQAENHSQASWAVATRTVDLTEGGFAALFDEGSSVEA